MNGEGKSILAEDVAFGLAVLGRFKRNNRKTRQSAVVVAGLHAHK